MFVPINQLEISENRFKVHGKKGVRKQVQELGQEAVIKKAVEAPEMNIPMGQIIGDKDNLVKRRKMIDSFGYEPGEFAYERAIGKNDSVYSNFTELIESVKRKVGRIEIRKGNLEMGHATGFMVSDQLLLTNWHVFENKRKVDTSVVQFNYEYDIHGNSKPSITFRLDSNEFFYSFEELDYCLVAVEPIDITGKHSLSSIGYIYLNPTLGKLGNENEESLNIIHHPNGDFKQLSIRENTFTKIMSTTIWYASDTAQGSSGSPVFNDQWQVVALHHMGVASRNEAGDYLDKDDNPIPIEDGSIDISKINWVANEGVRISVIRRHLEAQHPNSIHIRGVLDENIDLNEADESIVPQPLPSQSNNNTMPLSDHHIHVSVPSSLIKEVEHIHFDISTNRIPKSNTPVPVLPEVISDTHNEDFESLRLERGMDYSACEGYQSDFLGDAHRIPIPKPKDDYRAMAARLTGSRGIILRYYKFSVIQHSVKRMPMISAINIDGDPEKRLDRTERRDKWIRDNRMDFAYQLDNKFYSGSGFDRGHMSRREDANWGRDAEEALRNANLTCVHTNSCPQVPKLNRSTSSGVWGKLEKIILEKGAELEEGRTAKISVFNGPIFADNDPVYRGVQVPISFFKIVLWLSDDNELRATGFKLSQENLVDNIDFEELGIDENVVFKPYHCSIAELADLTHLDFDQIKAFDTFEEVEDGVVIEAEALSAQIKSKSKKRKAS